LWTFRQEIGSTAVDFLPQSANWNYNALLSGKDTTSIGFHDAAHSVSSIRYSGQSGFVIGGNDGWGQKDVHMPGRVFIGTKPVNDSGDMLHVNGAVRVQKVTVTLSGWADHVFAPDYRLPTLTEVESHIKDRQHLPGIPSEAEIQKTGVDTGDMLKRHMAKIEELTLYAIAQNKELTTARTQAAAAETRATAAQTESAALKARLDKLTERIERLERQSVKP
jgi:hypothetical protein